MAQETLSLKITADNSQAVAGLRETHKSLFNLKEELLKYQSAAWTEKDKAKVAAYNAEIQKLEVSIKKLSNAGKEGFDTMGNAVAKSGNALQTAFSGLRQIAYIVPGIGIAGIFNLAFEAIGKAAQGLDLFTNKESAAAEAAKKLNDELLKQREGAEKEISQLKALESVAANTSLSLDKRRIAVKELRDQYPGYFKDLSDEQILTGKVTDATNALTSAIYKRAEARAREADIAQKATQVFENELRIAKLQNDLSAAKKATLEANKRAAAPLGVQGASGFENASQVRLAAVADATAREVEITKELNKTLDINHNLMFDIANQQARINLLKADEITLDETAIKTTKEKNKVKKQVDWMQGFKVLALEGQARSEGVERVTEKPQNERIGKLLSPSPEFQAGIDFWKKFYKDLDNANEKTLKGLATYADTAANAFGNLFDALNNGLSIGDALGKMFEDLANQIAKAAIKAAIFSIVANVLSGGAGAAVGAVAGKGGGGFLDIFKSFLGKGFADGGVATGPQSGHLQLLHGTEAIFPMDKLAKYTDKAMMLGAMNMGGQNNQPIVMDTRLAGNDIWISQRRTDFTRNLTT